jgi:4'-phosphopantetheinyl transferase
VASDVDIWIVPLDRPEGEIGRLHGLLAAGERERAGAFPLPLRKRRYVARQGAVREILARYAAGAPEDLQLVRGYRGKPALREGGPCFSVSDSHELALVAVSPRELGVDVERIVERPAARRLPPAPGTLDEFYEAWTAHEAAGKASGAGLFGSSAEGHRWRSWRIDPAPGFVATLVAERGVCRLAIRRWTSQGH